MVIGIGTDIVNIERIDASLQRFGEQFARRILTPEEFSIFQGKRIGAPWLAKRFAAKEAMAKALGTGIGRDVRWHDMTVFNDGRGAPGMRLSGPAEALASSRGVSQVHISLSDEEIYALAFVVLSGQ